MGAPVLLWVAALLPWWHLHRAAGPLGLPPLERWVPDHTCPHRLREDGMAQVPSVAWCTTVGPARWATPQEASGPRRREPGAPAARPPWWPPSLNHPSQDSGDDIDVILSCWQAGSALPPQSVSQQKPCIQPRSFQPGAKTPRPGKNKGKPSLGSGTNSASNLCLILLK